MSIEVYRTETIRKLYEKIGERFGEWEGEVCSEIWNRNIQDPDGRVTYGVIAEGTGNPDDKTYIPKKIVIAPYGQIPRYHAHHHIREYWKENRQNYPDAVFLLGSMSCDYEEIFTLKGLSGEEYLGASTDVNCAAIVDAIKLGVETTYLSS